MLTAASTYMGGIFLTSDTCGLLHLTCQWRKQCLEFSLGGFMKTLSKGVPLTMTEKTLGQREHPELLVGLLKEQLLAVLKTILRVDHASTI